MDVLLGAQTRDYILSHLRSFMQKATIEMAWILTLSEEHGSLYGRRTDRGLEILCQDGKARELARALVTEGDVAQWKVALSSASS